MQGLFKRKPDIVEVYTFNEINHGARSDWKSLPQQVRDLYENGNKNDGVVFSDKCIYFKKMGVEQRMYPGDYLIINKDNVFVICNETYFHNNFLALETNKEDTLTKE